MQPPERLQVDAADLFAAASTMRANEPDRAVETIGVDDLPLGSFSMTVEHLRSVLDDGAGAAVVSGLPVGEHDVETASFAFWRIGLALGDRCLSSCEDRLSCTYLRQYIEIAAAEDTSCVLDDIDRRALDTFEEYAARPEFSTVVTLRAGDATVYPPSPVARLPMRPTSRRCDPPAVSRLTRASRSLRQQQRPPY